MDVPANSRPVFYPLPTFESAERDDELLDLNTLGAEDLLDNRYFLELPFSEQKGYLNNLVMSGKTTSSDIVQILLRKQRIVRGIELKGYDDILTVYIIGAGPVGLLTAIKLVDAYKDRINVTIFDKRKVHTRERTLFINGHVLHKILPSQLLTNTKLSQYGCGLTNLPGRDQASCVVTDDLKNIRRLAISTRVLEDDLHELLERNDYRKRVNFVYNPESRKEYIEKYVKDQPPHVLVGADGGALSLSLFQEQLPGWRPISKTPYKLEADAQSNFNRVKSYGLVVQFLPNQNDGPPKTQPLPRRQNRYRAFRQQYRNYKKCETDAERVLGKCRDEPLAYYIAIQISEAEKDRVVREMGDKEWVNNYELTSNGTDGKYLDRLIYDAGKIYNFNFYPGRVMSDIAVFDITVSSISPDQYSRVIRVIDSRGAHRNIWMPLIGDSILSVNFFSGTGVNTGFAMVEYIIKALAHLLPFDNSADLFHDKDRDAFNLSPGLSGYTAHTFQGLPRRTNPFPNMLPLTTFYSKEQLAAFRDLNKLQILVNAYRTGLTTDLQSGTIGAESENGLNRILSLNIFGSYMDFVQMVRTCHSQPAMFNRVNREATSNNMNLDLVDLDEEDEGLYSKAEDRFCLISHTSFDGL